MKIFINVLLALTIGSAVRAQTVDELAEFVSAMPRGSLGTPAYWMEMKSIIGWEKMILVVGYASNGPICEMMANMGAAQSPERQFRCTAAN